MSKSVFAILISFFPLFISLADLNCVRVRVCDGQGTANDSHPKCARQLKENEDFFFVRGHRILNRKQTQIH